MGLTQTHSVANVPELIWERLTKLHDAISQRRSRVTCLRRWSEFIRERDGHRCVDCHSRRNLSAHHIARKALFTAAELETGNGITLCGTCHRDAHSGFNGRPDFALPVDSQGGEKLPLMERLYSILIDDAVDRGLMNDDLYFLSDEVLDTLRKLNGYEQPTAYRGGRLEQAYLFLAEPERHIRQAIAEANGFPHPGRPMFPGGVALKLNAREGPQQSVIIQAYAVRTSPKRGPHHG